ncbi:MAG: SDR family NAD(P)-dependent oxidoreductase [Chloroflexota bacterium]
MSKGRYKNPVVATASGIFNMFNQQLLAERFTDKDRLDGKTMLITGANSGLGFATAVESAKRGACVIMGCLEGIPDAGEEVKEQSGSRKVDMRFVDLRDLDAIHALVDGFVRDHIKLDVVIFNAASAIPHSRRTIHHQDELFFVNYFANFVLSNLLLEKGIVQPDHKNQPRMIFISSQSHQGSSPIDYDEFGRYFEYGLAKAMSNYSYLKFVQNTFATELSRRLNPHEVVVQVNLVCPGATNTNIIRNIPQPFKLIMRGIFNLFFQPPEKACLPLVYLASSEDFQGRTNQYLHMFSLKRMDEKSYVRKEGEKLWEASEALWRKLDRRAPSVLLVPVS